MKKMNKVFAILFSGAALFLGACSSSDDGESTSQPEFPELQSFELTADQEQAVTFKANMDWTLTADKQWLKFIDAEGHEFSSLLGKAGDQNIRLKVTDSNLGFDKTTASAQLSMGGKQQAVFSVDRIGKQRTVAMYVVRGSETGLPVEQAEEAEIAYNTKTMSFIGFTANFDWRVLHAPDWIIENGIRDIRKLTGKGNMLVPTRDDMAYIGIAPEVLHGQKEDYIEIGAQAEGVEYTVKFPIRSLGIPTGEVEWSGTGFSKSLLFSRDGKWRKPNGPADYIEVDEPAPFSVRVRDFKYAVKFMEWHDGVPAEVTDAWFDLTDDGQGQLTLKAHENTGDARETGLFIIPEGTEVDYESYFNAEGAFVAGPYGILIAQRGVMKSLFRVWGGDKNGMGTEPIEDLTSGVAEAIAENLKLAKSIADNLGKELLEDRSFQRTFTADEWNKKYAAAGYMNKIQILPDDQEVRGEFTYFDRNGKDISVEAGKKWGITFTSYPSMRFTFGSMRPAFDALPDDKLIIVVADDKQVTGVFFLLKNN